MTPALQYITHRPLGPFMTSHMSSGVSTIHLSHAKQSFSSRVVQSGRSRPTREAQDRLFGWNRATGRRTRTRTTSRSTTASSKSRCTATSNDGPQPSRFTNRSVLWARGKDYHKKCVLERKGCRFEGSIANKWTPKPVRYELYLSPRLTQTVKTLLAVRCKFVDRQDHCEHS